MAAKERKRASAVLKIGITTEEREHWREVLMEYYKAQGHSDPDILRSMADRVIVECEIGWVHAPRSFTARIKRKSGYGMAKPILQAANQKRKANKQTREEVSAFNKIIRDKSLFDVLTEPEQEWWMTRIKQYTDEFDFNKSSDYVFLQQLLIEELHLRRTSIKQLQFPENTEVSKLLTESQKRILDLQQKLGITREQRADELDQREGTIAALSVTLDEKLKMISQIEADQKKEEEYYTQKKEERPPVNILPPKEKIIAILGIDPDEGVSDSFDNEDLSKKVEELHRETVENVPHITEHEQEKKNS